ncbi:beta-propeller domain-containing protein, partial [Myxococcota bacterium]
MHRSGISSSLRGLGLLLLAGCASDGVVEGQDSDPETGSVTTASQALQQATSCEDLLGRIQADAIAKLKARVEELKEIDFDAKKGSAFGEPMLVGPMDTGVNSNNPGNPTNSGGRATAGVAPPASILVSADDSMGHVSVLDGTSAAAEESASHDVAYSETNQQVTGVDEADIVKTDGRRVYVLHGDQLVVLDANPPSDTALALQAKIEGSPQEMFIHEDKVLVYSAVADPDQDTAKDCDEEVCRYDPEPYYHGGTGFTKMTVLDTSGETAQVVREEYVEGSYVSARKHGSLARGVIQGGFKAPRIFDPSIELRDVFGNPYSDAKIEAQLDSWQQRTQEDIEATELSDWLPRRYTKADKDVEAKAPECTRYYVPAPGATEYGQTSIETVDLAVPNETVPGVIVLGNASQVYANHDVLLLAQPDYWWTAGVEDRERTALHLFKIEGEETPYVASGYAPGVIHDQFSLDERNETVRLSSTQRVRGEDGMVERVNQVVTLRTEGEKLEVLGRSEELAPGETIYSTRFVGD